MKDTNGDIQDTQMATELIGTNANVVGKKQN